MTTETTNESAASWESYWHGASSNDAFTTGGFGHPGFPAIWDQITVGQVVVGLADGITDSGNVSVAPGMKISKPPPKHFKLRSRLPFC